MNGDLPEGWKRTTLSEICDINPPKPRANALPADAPVTFVPMPAVDAERGEITQPETRPFGRIRNGYTAFQERDVIMAKITPCMENGKAAIARHLENRLGFGSTEFHVLRPREVVLPEFIYHYIRQESFRRAAESHMTGSVGQKRVPAEFLHEAEIPLPPLDEQRQIVATLEELQPKVRGVQQRLDRVRAILKRFRQAVLAAACSGKLLHHEDEGAVRLGDLDVQIQTGPFGSSLHRSDYTRGGIPVVNPMHIVNGRICPTDEMTVSRATRERLKSYVLKAGDVIVARRGEMGRCAVINHQAEGYLCGTGSLFIRANHDVIDPNFLQIVMSSPTTVRFLSERSVGTTMSNLNQDILLDVEFFLPSLAEQNAAVSRVKELFALSDQIEARCDQARAHADNLTQSILAKAFRGDLLTMHNRCRVG